MSEAGDNNSNDYRCNSSGGNFFISSSRSNNDDMFNIEVGSSSSLDDSMLSMSDDGNAMAIMVDYLSDHSDESDHEMCEAVFSRSRDNSMDAFVRRKMLDRPPCYDDIEYDRIASPDEAPIAGSYDRAPIDDPYDVPPPLYDAIHYARPGTLLQGILNPSLSSSNEVFRPNYSIVTEVTTMTTSEVVVHRANQENMIQRILSYSSCELPRRNNLTFTTVYEGPRMTTTAVTTAITDIGRTNEEITQRHPHNLLQIIQRYQSLIMSLPRLNH